MSFASRQVEWVLLALFALVPPAALAFDEPYLFDLFARVLIFAIAAVSLDLILGYGGLVSFGHAAYLGVGGYAVGMLYQHDLGSGFLQFPVAIAASGLIALAVGWVCLRTSGLYFIMITLAFAQMLYYLGISLKAYGGDDGMRARRSEFFQPIDLNDQTQFYYLVLLVLGLTLWLCRRLVHSRFGLVLQGARANERRLRVLGVPVFRYRLTAFVIAGVICGIAGALFANLNEYASPSAMHWTRSGELIVMVILGGTGTLVGPVMGAALFILLESYLAQALDVVARDFGQHWQAVFGPLLVAVALFARGGLAGLLRRGRDG
jgi:branched-chain amino acid transport system permease protein